LQTILLFQVLKSDKSSEGCDEPQGTYIDVLKEKISKIDKEIDELGIEYSEDELQIHIDKLHEYNEIKDTGQLLLGKIGKLDTPHRHAPHGWIWRVGVHLP
jgi:hypothetical protein